MEGAPLAGTLKERQIFRGWDVEGSVDGVSFRKDPVGEPVERVHLLGTVRDSRGAPEMELLSLRERC